MQTNDPSPKSRPFRVLSARDLGAAVKYFRNLNGMTQEELAVRSGIHRSYLAKLEQGHATEAVERLMILFKELGVRVNLVQED